MNHVRSPNLHFQPFLPLDVFSGPCPLFKNINRIKIHEAVKNQTMGTGLRVQNVQFWPQFCH